MPDTSAQDREQRRDLEEQNVRLMQNRSDADCLLAKRCQPVSHGMESTFRQTKVNPAMIAAVLFTVDETLLRQMVDIAKRGC